MTAKDIVKYFCELYEKEYGFIYNPRWAKDCKLVKNKLEQYNEETVKKVIDYAIENYSSKWSKKDFPLPTIGAVFTWMFNDCLYFIKLEEKESSTKNELKYMTDSEIEDIQARERKAFKDRLKIKRRK